MGPVPAALLDDPRTHLLVLTGAGVSAESGIPTFRGIDGLWENHRVEEVASPSGFEADPALVWRFYSMRRRAAKGCLPNRAHQALVLAEQALGPRFLLATQNVDGLHRKAGSRRMIELHGSLFRTRCFGCDLPEFEDQRAFEDGVVPRCERCKRGALRPGVVWFGEALDPRHLEEVDDFMVQGAREGRLVFLAVGTSGAVYPAAGLVHRARRLGAETWLLNADPADNGGAFHHFLQGQSGELLPALLSRR